jgi:hypothetical protein
MLTLRKNRRVLLWSHPPESNRRPTDYELIVTPSTVFACVYLSMVYRFFPSIPSTEIVDFPSALLLALLTDLFRAAT